ncbi:hypothetical protein AX17_006635 [Amanita inopinata Kibby_2008]|nr:hypothetical protein AX17_006635 [Amanita inopinata Kibby_2008]
MDDALEPNDNERLLNVSNDDGENGAAATAEEGEEEDGGLDWTKLLPSTARPVIPKRGEKEFEPRAQAAAAAAAATTATATESPTQGPSTLPGTSLQQHVLNRARSAMFEALRTARTISSKNISYGVWYPTLSRTHVTLARGVHFSSMGHSAPRPCVAADEGGKTVVQKKRLELLPEETIYLVERGSMLCWKSFDSEGGEGGGEGVLPGVPMSVQQVYTEMIGKQALTLEKFQVYAYLRRLGYIVTRTEPPYPYYPTPPALLPPLLPKSQSHPFLHTLVSLFRQSISRLVRLFFVTPFNWWQPVPISRWLHHNKNYTSLFKSLRLIPAGHSTPLYRPHAKSDASPPTPYKIFYNVYKPNTPFKKTAPGKADFQVVVVNARTTPMPTLYELTDLFGCVPPVPPFVPRKRGVRGQEKNQASANKANASARAMSTIPTPAPPPPPPPPSRPSWIQRWSPSATPAPPLTPTGQTNPKPNPFASLKMGKKIIIIAAVDTGNISFFRFGQGGFEEWPMI